MNIRKRVEAELNLVFGPALVAFNCNPSYPGGRDQEDHGSRRVLDK
jgi:hypothetical protein